MRGFTSRHNVDKLVFYEEANDALAAIAREKQIKGGSRRKKIALIEGVNPGGGICTTISRKRREIASSLRSSR